VATKTFSRRGFIFTKKMYKLFFVENISLYWGDSKDIFATKVVEMATRKFWLDNAGINGSWTKPRFYVLLDTK
jgi:hypothetical protein